MRWQLSNTWGINLLRIVGKSCWLIAPIAELQRHSQRSPDLSHIPLTNIFLPLGTIAGVCESLALHCSLILQTVMSCSFHTRNLSEHLRVFCNVLWESLHGCPFLDAVWDTDKFERWRKFDDWDWIFRIEQAPFCLQFQFLYKLGNKALNSNVIFQGVVAKSVSPVVTARVLRFMPDKVTRKSSLTHFSLHFFDFSLSFERLDHKEVCDKFEELGALIELLVEK